MKRISVLLLASAATLSLAACGNDATDTPGTETTTVADESMAPVGEMAPTAAAGTETIVAVAQGNPEFSTLVGAVTAADLGTTLSGTGPFTVFAPTNAAFAKVDKATLDNLMMPAQKTALSGLLTYHVVPGRITAADLTKLITDGGGTARVKTVNGGELTATANGGTITLTDAKGGKATVTSPDVAASNGIIHAIDTVVMPS